jgi:thiol:disulfide interchange protein
VLGSAAPSDGAREVPAGHLSADADDETRTRPIDWSIDPEGARDEAARQKKPLLVFVRAEWSTAALQMEREVLRDPKIARAARPFVAVRLDATAEAPKTYYWMTGLDVRTVPSVLLLSTTSARREAVEGLVTAEELVTALNDFVEGE